MGRRTNSAVWIDKERRWKINVQKDGERKSFYSSKKGKPGRDECNSKADSWLDDNLFDIFTPCQKLFDKWMEDLEDTTGTGYRNVYKSMWKNWAMAKIGRKKIGDLTEQDVQGLINQAYKKGSLSKKTLTNLRSMLNAFIKYCRKRRTTKLICEDLSIPRNAEIRKREILQPAELSVLFKSCSTTYRGKIVEDLFINAYRFEVATGLRPGELIGMKWSDIKDSRVNIIRSINREKETTTGKNFNAQREFALNGISESIINDQRKLLIKYGIRSDYVFPTRFGEWIKQDHYYDSWKRYRDYNFKGSQVTPYELRHTFVSIVKELPVGLVKPLVGHSLNMDTYGTYGHEVDGEKDYTAMLIEDQIKKFIG